ncbi:MAG: penicillin-binding transpeptidase domain-containing protein [Pyrinomonadaceae bacterium]
MKNDRVIRVLNVALFFCVVSLLASTQVFAQKKKEAANTKSKTAVTTTKSKTTAAKDTKNNKNSKIAAKDAKNDKNDKASKIAKTASVRNTGTKENKKELAARKAFEERILAERRRAEEARRQAVLEEKRRREAVIRAAAARHAAFERGLRTDTVEKMRVDDTTGEDLQIRAAAVNALGNRAGTVVVMEAQTGKIVTIVNQDWAIKNSFKPCSTIKLVTATGGENENLIDSEGNLTKQNARRNLDDAIAFSDNTYFQRIGMNLGNEKMISYARALGLGEKTGINADGETPGKLPYGNNNLRIYSHGDDFEVTPLQLAVAVTAIANGGKLVVPQIQKNRTEKTKFNGFYKREVNVPKQNIQRLIPGMLGAAEYGTARRAGIADLNAAGKTGSCIFNGSWIGLFASVAPVENPQYAVVVITRGQSERGKYAALVAGKIYEALRPRFSDKRNKVLLAQFKPKHKSGNKDNELLNEDEDEDTDDSNLADTDVRDPNPKKGVTREVAKTDNVQNSENLQNDEVEKETVPAPKMVTNIKKDSPTLNPVVIEYKKDTETAEPALRPQISRPRVVKNP